MGVLDAPAYSRSQAEARFGKPLRHVSGRGQISDTQSNGTDTSATSRIRFPIPKAVTAFRLVFANFIVASGTGELNGTGSGTLTIKCAIEDTTLVSGRSAGTTMVPVYFNGARSGTLEAGGVLVSDPVYGNVPDSWAVFVRTLVSCSAGVKWPTLYPTSSTGSVQTDGSGAGEGVTVGSDLVDSGAFTASSGFAFGPVAIIAEPVLDLHSRGVLVVGDSIAKGNGIILADGSYPQQAAINAGLPVMRVACGGESLSTVKAQSAFWRRMQLARFCRHAVINYIINDIINGASLATVKADAILVWTMFSRLGMKVHQCTCLPHPGASTDGYTTASGQSIVSSSQEAVRTGFNSWLRSGQAAIDAAGALTSVIDGAALVEVNSSGVLTLNGGLWKPLGAATVTGTATGVSTTTLTDSGKSRTTNQDQSLVMAIISATTGAGQVASIKSNTATVWTLSAITLPTGTVTYQVAPGPTWDHLHPTMALHDLITAGLDLSYLKAA